MSKNTQLTALAVNTEANALGVLLNSGFLDLLDGAQPATGDTAISTQNKLASITFNATAFGNSVAGVITAGVMTACSAANLTGNCTWGRCYKTDHTTAVFDVSVGTTLANVILNSIAIQANAQVSVSSFTHTIPVSTANS